MGLEAGEFIADLVSNWPLPTDKRREGDDHLRLIKKVLKNTFPNLNGPVTSTPAKLNNLPENVQGLITELKKHIVPMRAVIAFSGTEGQVPTGWVLCDGRSVAGFGIVPDLRSRFVLGASSGNALGSIGGAWSNTTGNSGSHVHVGQAVALNVSQLPPHSHRVFVPENSADSNADGWLRLGTRGIPGEDVGPFAYRSHSVPGDQLIENTGSGQAHSHGMESAGAHSHSVNTVPPYFALAYIIKVVDWVEPG